MSLHDSPIENIGQAKAYLDACIAADLIWHLEDDPAEIVKGGHQNIPPLFSPEDVPLVRLRTDELYALPSKSWGYDECPIGYMMRKADLRDNPEPSDHYRDRCAELDDMCDTLAGMIDGFKDAEDMDDLAKALWPIYHHLSQEFSEARDDLANAQADEPEPEPERPPHDCPDCANSWPVWCQDCSDEVQIHDGEGKA